MAAPKQLFIAADGPRRDRPNESELCEQTRRIVESVDWDCEVHTLFRQANLGCRKAVSEGISWFFEHVEEGIVIEDDCVAHPTFFKFCTEMLERYRDEKRVMCITGNNFQDGQKRGDKSYYFSVYNHCWGWASWKTSWARYDSNLESWPELRANKTFSTFLRPSVAQFWANAFDSVANGTVDTWDIIWTLSCWGSNGLTVTPNVNLVSNIGFDERATHTVSPESNFSKMETPGMQFPLKHPDSIHRDIEADCYTENSQFAETAKSPRSKLTPKRLLRTSLRRIRRLFRL